MTEQEVAKKGAVAKTSVKSYQRGIEAEKQKMKNYSKGFETSAKTFETNVKAFQAEIQAQKKKNKESVSHMANAVKFFISEVDKKKRDFKSYTHGAFKDYIKAFWG